MRWKRWARTTVEIPKGLYFTTLKELTIFGELSSFLYLKIRKRGLYSFKKEKKKKL